MYLGGNTGQKEPSRNIALHDNLLLTHCFLFALEHGSKSSDKEVSRSRHILQKFMVRSGGLHLLLMLINAHYTKPLSGRHPGWVFTTLDNRIDISRRALRNLIADLMSEGLIERIPGTRDHRKRSYRLTPRSIEAWESMTASLRRSIPDVLETLDPDHLADVDYRIWDSNIPPSAQPPRR